MKTASMFVTGDKDTLLELKHQLGSTFDIIEDSMKVLDGEYIYKATVILKENEDETNRH